MPLSHLEHYLVCTDDIEATRVWYAQVLGLREGWHPEVNFPAVWMYLGNVDIVHIAPSAKNAGSNQKTYLGRTSQDTGSGTGALDHIAFRATGLAQMKSHLKVLGINFNERRANGQALYQLFMLDPNGIKVELNFDASEAEGHKPEVNAADFVRQD
jgi:catechol 2,3-dioxygenase-like lactoylglutathione lyase family enzyme